MRENYFKDLQFFGSFLKISAFSFVYCWLGSNKMTTGGITTIARPFHWNQYFCYILAHVVLKKVHKVNCMKSRVFSLDKISNAYVSYVRRLCVVGDSALPGGLAAVGWLGRSWCVFLARNEFFFQDVAQDRNIAKGCCDGLPRCCSWPPRYFTSFTALQTELVNQSTSPWIFKVP